MLMITGRRPAKRAGGLYRKPEIARPSKLGQCTSSASVKFLVSSPAVSLSVQRVTVPLARSNEYASAGARAEVKVKPSSAPLRRQRTSEIRPVGSLGRRRSAPVEG